MQINNPFHMNDWEIKKFLHVILAIQLAMWGAIGLDLIGLQIPILRQLIGFIYLAFIPGIIILRILKLHTLGKIETLLYTVGLSITTLMFTGFFMNLIYLFFGISGPLSTIPLIITISLVVLILCTLCCMWDKDFSNPSFLEIKDILSPPVLFLLMIPFLAIFGTYLVNFHNNNIILLFLIVVISLVVILIGFDKFIPTKFYPLTVFVIALSLLFHNSLISMYIWGWDIHVEYYIANLVITNSVWDSTIYSNVNAMLSIVMLTPIFSAITDMNLTWIFKIIYPLLYSLVPLGLYRVFQKQTNDKNAFLSVFFLMSIFTFYKEMPTLARQQIAELFLVLVILLLFDKHMNKMKRSILLIIFSFSLVVSHYGLSYIFMASFILVWFLLYLDKRYQSKNTINTITSSLVLLYIIFTLTWYIYISSSSTFNSIVFIGDHIADSITDLLNPEFSEGMRIISESTLSLHAVTKYLHLIAQLFISVGILTLLLNRSKIKLDREYIAFSVVFFMMLLAAIVVPFLASSIATTRIYHISLIFLAPFFVIGVLTIFNVANNIAKAFRIKQCIKNPLKILSLFLAIFLLFNSGWVYEVAKDAPTSNSLNTTIDSPHFNYQEVLGAKWLYNVKVNNHIYADYYRWLLLGSFEWGTVRIIPFDINKTQDYSYVYLGNLNVDKKEILIADVKSARKVMKKYINSSIIVDSRYKIYDNAGAQIFI